MNNTVENSKAASSKKKLLLVTFILFSILLVGVFYLFATPGQTVNLAFAYVVGLSMIVLPCTLPLAFVIVPLAMGKSPKKGLLMSIYFGLGLALMLSIYGLFVALVGQALGLDQAVSEAGTVSKILFIIGGLAAFTFGLAELNLIKFKIPSFSGSYPKFIQNQGDYLKAFFLGLFLGNAGVGCPNPLFYVLLGDIAVVGSVVNGWWLGFIHGIGRATPLVFLAILGILGVNAVSDIAKKTAVVKKWTGVSLILLGAFIFISGTSHEWYENTIVHKGWNQVVNIIAGDKVSEIMDHEEEPGTPQDHEHAVAVEGEEEHEGDDYIPAPWSWITLLILIVVPLVWYKLKQKSNKIHGLEGGEQNE